MTAMKKLCIAGALGLAAAAAGPAQAVSLIGQSATGSFTAPSGSTNELPFVSPQVVGAGVEFQGAFEDQFGQPWRVGVDVYDTGFLVTFASVQHGNLSNFLTGRLFRIDLGGLSGLGALSLLSYGCQPPGSFACTTFGGGPSVESLGGDSDSAFVWFRTIRNGETYDFGFAAIPEPEAWALMILGLGATGAAMRTARRRRRRLVPTCG